MLCRSLGQGERIDVTGLDKTYAKLALEVLTEPRDIDWHQKASQLMDEAPDYAYKKDESGQNMLPSDVYELAGRILGYCAGLVEWRPEP